MTILLELVLEVCVAVCLLVEGRAQFADAPAGGLDVVRQWDVDFDRRQTINSHNDRGCI